MNGDTLTKQFLFFIGENCRKQIRIKKGSLFPKKDMFLLGGRGQKE